MKECREKATLNNLNNLNTWKYKSSQTIVRANVIKLFMAVISEFS
jgi:hypothetical protein